MSRNLSRVFRRPPRSRFADAIRTLLVVMAVLVLFALIYAGAYWQGAVSIRDAMSGHSNSDAGVTRPTVALVTTNLFGYQEMRGSVGKLPKQ